VAHSTAKQNRIILKVSADVDTFSAEINALRPRWIVIRTNAISEQQKCNRYVLLSEVS